MTDLLSPSQIKQGRRWLLLGVIALGVAGIYAGVLGNTTSPFFYKALVVHVDLSVLVWFLSFECLWFSLLAISPRVNMLLNAAFFCFAAGVLLIPLSALTDGAPFMSNYIPVIYHPVFFVALSLLLCGVLGAVAGMRASWNHHPERGHSFMFGIRSTGSLLLLAILCFTSTVIHLPNNLTGQVFYEYAFWGGGHILQFAHTQLMLVCWVWLASAAGITLKLQDRWVKALYYIAPLASLAALLVSFFCDPQGDMYRNLFTHLMRDINGIAPLVMAEVIVYSFVPPAKAGVSSSVYEVPAPAGKTLSKIALFMSILLFFAGGVLGYMIAGSNVTVPAHYHGSIVGVTLAFMGLAYVLLPKLGWADVSGSKLALFQPVIYGGGQLCWMAGMAILGAHGVPRKTPGSADTVGALAAFLKHGGDGLALIGGLLFVFVVLNAAMRKSNVRQ